jgi:CubicO group peptidase (beta-lactamase class C family)
VISEDQIAVMAATESAGAEDAVSFEPTRYSAGFEKAPAGRAHLLDAADLTVSEAAFGFTGLGGSVGFADPGEHLSFGYAMNRHPRRGEAYGARFQPLVDATYRALGFRSCASGRWIK